MTDVLLLLITSQNANKDHPMPVSYGEDRIRQYVDGLSILFEYDFDDKVDILLCDNTTDQIDQRLADCLPVNTKFNTYNNNTGASSKSIGLFDQWKSCENTIKQYEWVIHFEPRQLLTKYSFFDSFFLDKKNLFNIRANHFWTGLFSIDTNSMMKYLSGSHPPASIEYHLFDFMKNIPHKHEEINVLWNDAAKKTWIEI